MAPSQRSTEAKRLLQQMRRYNQIGNVLTDKQVAPLPPGDTLGAELDQHLQALRLASADLKPPSALTCGPEGATTALEFEVDEVVQRTAKQQQQQQQQLPQKAAAEQQRATLNVLTVHWRLLLSSGSVDKWPMDRLQRRLASCLPASTSLVDAEPGAMEQQLQQLRCRCAIAKGSHVVSYKGYGAATALVK
jgi:hypothetical protein